MMGAVALNAGLKPEQFGIFKDAGFRGMYNMSLQNLKSYKGVSDDKAVIYDVMGLTELAGNLFRVTQTAERIKSQSVSGLNNLSQTAQQVGGEVRKMMVNNSGITPENLAIEDNISNVKKQLKSANREMIKIDKPKK
jgi:DNA-damage-inducible protein D